MVVHPADTIRRFAAGRGGKSDHQRVKGMPFTLDCMEFGGCAWYFKSRQRAGREEEDRGRSDLETLRIVSEDGGAGRQDQTGTAETLAWANRCQGPNESMDMLRLGMVVDQDGERVTTCAGSRHQHTSNMQTRCSPHICCT